MEEKSEDKDKIEVKKEYCKKGKNKEKNGV
jgi:hypothetical protein